MTEADLEAWLGRRRAEVEALLDARLPQPPAGEDAGRLVEAMRYMLLAPGKRLRPILALAAAEAVGAPARESVRIAAAAVELVHCYSLIHDDLPAMDDDDVRRGRPACHKAFGEATAILAGDALLTLAFEWLAEAAIADRASPVGARPAGDHVLAVLALARGAGMTGMVRGQARDLGETAPPSLAALERLHAEKTAALFRAAVLVGGAIAGAAPADMDALDRYGLAYGVAFQHADDRADAEHGALRAEAETRIPALIEEAVRALAPFGPGAGPLRGIVRGLARAA